MDLYKSLKEVKEEISTFIMIVNENKYKNCEILEQDIRSIGKFVIFLKQISTNNFENNFLKLIIYANFQMFDSIIRNNIYNERFNLYKRIYIENLFRYLLDIKNTRISMFEMKEDLKENNQLKEIIDYFYSNHKNASGVLHVNEIKDIKINEYYLNILEDSKKFDLKNFNKNLKNTLKLIGKTTEILIIKEHEIISRAFYNQMEILEYLIGNKNYSLYTKYLY